MRSLSKYFVLFVGTKNESSLRNDDAIQIENVFKTGNGDIAFNYIQNDHSYIGFHDSQQRKGYSSGLLPVSHKVASGQLLVGYILISDAYLGCTKLFQLQLK